MTWGWALAGLVAAAIAIAVLDRLLLAAEERGWLYYRRRKASRRATANALMSVLEIYKPEVHHTVEESRRYDADEEADDDPLRPEA